MAFERSRRDGVKLPTTQLKAIQGRSPPSRLFPNLVAIACDSDCFLSYSSSRECRDKRVSLCAQSDDWVDCGGAAGRQIGCDHRCCNQNESYAGKCRGVGSRYAKKERLNESFQSHGADDSNADS